MNLYNYHIANGSISEGITNWIAVVGEVFTRHSTFHTNLQDSKYMLLLGHYSEGIKDDRLLEKSGEMALVRLHRDVRLLGKWLS